VGRRLLTSLLAAAMTLTLATSASAITNGELDGERHPAVGALLIDVPAGWGLVCTVTLVAPRTVLTADHCFDLVPPGAALAVSFDTLLHDGPLGASRPLVSPRSNPHPVTAVARPSGSGGDIADLALATLRSVPGRIRPLPLDRTFFSTTSTDQLRSADYVNVGYGITDPGFGWRESVARRWSTSSFLGTRPTSVQLSQNAARDHGGTCQGDSGGPVLVDGAVVAVISKGDPNCRATNTPYRLDTPAAEQLFRTAGL